MREIDETRVYMRQYCIYVQIRKNWSQRLGIAIPKLVPQRMASSESTQFQAKLKKIGAVVTRAGTYNRNPIVALLGWNSAQDKHLAKYSEIFENKGFDTIRLSANPFNTFILLSRVKDVSLKLLNILIEMKSDPNQPVILYSLSMGGFNVYYFIHQAILAPGQKYFKRKFCGTYEVNQPLMRWKCKNEEVGIFVIFFSVYVL